MKKQYSFQTKIQFILAGLSVLALGIMFIISSSSSKGLIGGKETLVHSSIDSILDKIDRNLFERYGDVQAFSMSEPARSGDARRINSFMNDMMGAYAPIYDLMFVINTKGNVVAINTVDKAGKEIDVESIASNNYADQDWFKEAISGNVKPGTAYIKDLYVDQDTNAVLKNGGKAMMFVAPIRDASSGKITGVWSNRMSWNDVVEAIIKEESAKVKSDRITAVFPYLYNKEGLYLYHPEGEEYVLKKKEDGFVALNKDNPYVLSHLDSQVAQFNGEVIEAKVVSKGYSIYPGLNWVAGLQVPLKDPQITFNNWIKVSAFLLIFVANIFGYFFVKGQSRMIENIISKLKHESESLRKSSTQILSESQVLSESATQQAAAIEETVSSMEEMTSMLAQTTQNASMSLGIAEDGHKKAEIGRDVITRLSNAMEEISSSNAKLDGLVKLIEEIRNKTKVINDIVFETRLLSFNASIEAARAGAHGKGFAVVAEEVGKLASMSGKAADEIRTLLDSSTLEVTNVVKGTHSKVTEGQSVSVECRESFEGMGSALEKIAESVRMITSASREQEQGVKQTNQAMNEMDQATQKNTRGADGLSQQANRLSSSAKALDDSISKLNAVILGSASLNATHQESILAASDNVIAFSKPEEVKQVVTASSLKKASRDNGRWKSA